MDAAQPVPAPAGSPAGGRPRAVDAAVVLVVVAAAINALIGVLVAIAAPASRVPVPTAPLVALVGISVLYAVAIVVLILLFRAGRPWARGAFFSVSALSLLTLFSVNALNLAVIALLIAADVLLYRRPVGIWARALRGLRT